ncbi:putative DNA ligase [Trypanosoma theileri]|uniref:Putative DNA ligase n=1 Tax=Trypanosoma theileri TaxID=67003 RepID=A0A1X0NVK9_9TRYP|nr:putative DNA ligase [Trypanosoma theileri]ORC88568.1 putative DNA ligase [Trypanosoma theileri]
MFRLHRILRSLPFEPMALSAFETIERVSTSSGVGTSSKASTSQNPLYFISPKHDGVRIVSYVSERAESQKSTCFSRFGRPVHGMFWIEEELQLLRWLCGDPRLVLDGELYIHRESSDDSDNENGVKTGFLAVSALVHRLRGPKSACSTEEEVLSYVASLPRFCIFDIVSFQPSDNINLNNEKSVRGLSQIEKERLIIILEVMKANHISDMELLRVIPNYSVFSQRLKAMNFLMSLLQRAYSSPILFPGRNPTNNTNVTDSAFAASHLLKSNKRIKQKGITTNSKNIGGEYVQLIQYSILHSLEDAKRVYLNKYVSNGYEGAVIRSATNVYEVREKEKGMLLGLLEPILPGSENLVVNTKGSRRRGQHIHNEESTSLLCTYTSDKPANTVNDDTSNLSEIEQSKAEDANHEEIAKIVLKRAKQNTRRSSTVVKLLPFCDKEYAILKPLLKLPSSNPRARRLVSIPLSSLHEGRSAITTPKTSIGRAASEKNKDSKVVVFYGLQCLSDTGRVFNVPLPKMDVTKQRALLNHLLEVTGGSKKRGKSDTRQVGRRSLTGLYATVKFPTLTEHGIPRFGQVKAIRGGKGWFM